MKTPEEKRQKHEARMERGRKIRDGKVFRKAIDRELDLKFDSLNRIILDEELPRQFKKKLGEQ